jgi:hypothetical protein
MRSLFPKMQPEANSHVEVEKAISRGPLTVKNCLCIIVGCWLINLAVLLVLQLCHQNFGFKVWPMGEDRVWISLLQNNHGADVARAFWHLNDRNPLSPWWYMAVSPIIMSSEFGIYLVRKMVDPILAMVTFVLLDKIGGAKHRAFCLATAVLILFWNFSYFYIEQIMWNFLLALTCTLLTVMCYQKFLEQGRRQSVFQALSLVLYFVSFTSYTLQSGAVGANFILALTQQTGEPLSQKFKNACVDAFPFFALLGIYLLTWTTASKPVVDYYHIHLERIKDQFIASVWNFVWQNDYSNFFMAMSREWTPVALYGLFLLLSAVAFFFLNRALKDRAPENLESETKSTVTFLVNLSALILAVGLPTILVESTSHLWLPGTRVRMIGQFVSPCLFACVILSVSQIFQRFNFRFTRQVMALSFSVLFSAAVLMGFQYNKMLVTQTAFERRLAQGLRWYILPGQAHRYFVVRLDHCNWNVSQYLLDMFVETAFNLGNLHLRIIPDYLPDHIENHPHWFIIVNEKGVKHAAIDFGHGFIPWNQVIFLSFDGQKIQLIDPLTADQFKGLQIKWLAKEPIHQSLTPDTFAIAKKALTGVEDEEVHDLPNPTDPH